MKASRFFIGTLKEAPTDAEIVSHQLMMRAGMIRRVAGGIYSYLPIGLRSIRKVEAIVREEMNRAGALELLMPAVQPAELWQQLCGAVLEGLLFARIWGIEDDDRSVKAVHDAAEAIKAADSESGGTAVICCPMSAAQVYEVAALGQRVPRKSTSFGPKPRTGLVLRLFAEG